MILNKFSVKRALQILFYLQKNTTNTDRFDIMYLLKMVFFADRFHIRHYGNIATYDKYIAMIRGPVGSNMKDLITKGENPDIEELSEYSVKIKDQSESEMSESLKESLDFAIANYGGFGPFELSNITHDYPEWKKFKDDLESGKIKSAVMDLSDFFDDPVELKNSNRLNIISDPFKDEKDFLIELKENFNDTFA